MPPSPNLASEKHLRLEIALAPPTPHPLPGMICEGL